MKDENTPVNNTDELSVAGGRAADRVRSLGEYDPTNMPLSEHEIEERNRRGTKWVPRTTETIGELTPLPDEEPGKN